MVVRSIPYGIPLYAELSDCSAQRTDADLIIEGPYDP